MGFGAATTGTSGLSKFDYAKYLASALVYLAHLQRDSAGLIVFADDVLNFVQPTARQGQLMRLWHGIDGAALGKRTNFRRPFEELQQFLKRRGITVLISDFFEDPQTVIDTVAPLRHRGNELVLFHLLHPQELTPKLDGPALLLDMETGEALEATPEYARTEYRDRMNAHVESLRSKAKGAGLSYHLLTTDKPLDAALREYFLVREGQI